MAHRPCKSMYNGPSTRKPVRLAGLVLQRSDARGSFGTQARLGAPGRGLHTDESARPRRFPVITKDLLLPAVANPSRSQCQDVWCLLWVSCCVAPALRGVGGAAW